MQYGCDGPFADCCDGHSGAGCADPACTASVCSADLFCCETQWDDICAAAACQDPNCQCDPIAGKPWQDVECGEVVCGTFWSSINQRDTDWYRFNVGQQTRVEWNVVSEYPVTISILDGSCPAKQISTATSNCPSGVSATLEPGVYVTYVAPIPFACVTCGAGNSHYVAMLTCSAPCTADVTDNGVVDVDDLLLVINSWGPCTGCAADMTGNNVVDVDDLLTIINGWGPCG
jgi:hypothetical protein